MKQSELAKSLKLFIGLTCIILAICAFVIIPKAGKDMALESPEYSYLYYPFLVFIWITIIPFYAALFEGWKISNEINKDNSFSKKNMNSLNRIRRYALSECFLYFVGALILLFKHFNYNIICNLYSYVYFSICSCTCTPCTKGL